MRVLVRELVRVLMRLERLSDPVTTDLNLDSLKEYFEEHTRSGRLRFYVSSKFN